MSPFYLTLVCKSIFRLPPFAVKESPFRSFSFYPNAIQKEEKHEKEEIAN